MVGLLMLLGVTLFASGLFGSDDDGDDSPSAGSEPTDPQTTPIGQVLGTSGADTLGGTQDADTIRGAGGPDSITGAGGDDRLFGDTGNDSITGGNGDDYLAGGFGQDVVLGQNGDDFLWGGEGDDRLWGGEGDDLIIGGGNNDVLGGGAGDDVLVGNLDIINNSLVAGPTGEADRLFGGPGDDQLLLGNGDFGTGNDGEDAFNVMVGTTDTPVIRDFEPTEDVLVVFYDPDIYGELTTDPNDTSGADLVSFGEDQQPDGDVLLSLVGSNSSVPASGLPLVTVKDQASNFLATADVQLVTITALENAAISQTRI